MPGEPEGYAPRRNSPLPRVGVFVKTVFGVGVKSLRPALPLLAVVYFWTLGLNLCAELLKGRVPIGPMLFAIVLLLLPLCPLYPSLYLIQNSVLRGGSGSLVDSWRAAWSRLPHYLGFIVVLCLFLAGPPVIALSGFSLGPGFVLTAFVGVVYAVITGTLFRVGPALVLLNSQGPLSAVRESISMVKPHFAGVLGRCLAVAGLVGLASFVIVLPLIAIEMSLVFVGITDRAAMLPGLIIQSLANTVGPFFNMSADLVLYRALEETESEGADTPAEVTPRRESPFRFE